MNRRGTGCSMISEMPQECALREVFHGELLDGEDIRWVGQPDPSVIFSRADRLLVPVSLLWVGFAIFWEATFLSLTFKGAGGGGPPLFAVIVGIPFLVMGLHEMLGRFI